MGMQGSKKAYYSVRQYVPDIFSFRNGLKNGESLMLLLVNFALECAIAKVQVNQENLKPNGTQQVLSCVDVNLLGENINTVEKNR
jgi:hypothetical protein